MPTSYGVGKLLVELRERRQLSLESAAFLLDISPGALERLERGERVDRDGMPRPVRIFAGMTILIAHRYQLNVDEQAALFNVTGYTFYKPGEI